jgi:hypothetical protein
MMARFAGRNGAIVRVEARGLAGGRLVGRGVAVSAGRGVGVGEAGARLAVGMGEGAVLCTPGGVGIGPLVILQARPGIMALKKKATNRMRLFFTDASL